MQKAAIDECIPVDTSEGHVGDGRLGRQEHELALCRHQVVIAEELGVSPAEVVEMEKRLAGRDLSFDPTPEADDDNHIFTPAVYLPSPELDPAIEIENEQWSDWSSSNLSLALGGLDDRSRDIVSRRWLTEDKATLHELADEYGISAERIRQIEVAAMKKLRKLIKTED